MSSRRLFYRNHHNDSRTRLCAGCLRAKRIRRLPAGIYADMRSGTRMRLWPIEAGGVLRGVGTMGGAQEAQQRGARDPTEACHQSLVGAAPTRGSTGGAPGVVSAKLSVSQHGSTTPIVTRTHEA